MEQIVVTHLNGTTLKLLSKENSSRVTRATQTVELLGNDTVDLSVVSGKKLTFHIGDKITVFGRDYTLNTPAEESKNSEDEFVYDLQLEGAQYDLSGVLYNVNMDTTTNQIQDISGDSLTGDLGMFISVLLSNANRVYPGKWVLGTWPGETETRTETFSDEDNCLSVLQSLCSPDKYNQEFYITINPATGVRTLNIGATGSVFPFTFEYGKGKGIYKLKRGKVSSSNIITRLNVFGSSRNIVTTRYRAAKLCLPGKTKAQSFLEDATAIEKFGVREGSKTFEDIYPHREGTVSEYDPGAPYDFFDTTTGDNAMFDLNEKDENGKTKYLIEGRNAKVHFNTGNLAGYEFEISAYNHATKMFTIIKTKDENGYEFPSATTAAFQPAAGDKYVLLDIDLPQSYVDTAESDLQNAGSEHLAANSQPRVQYSLTVERLFLKDIVGSEVETNIFWVGDYIPVKDADLNVDSSIRIKSFTRDLLDEFMYTLNVADQTYSVSITSRVIASLNNIDKIVQINSLNDPARARRNYKATQELVTMIEVLQAEAALIGNDPASQYTLAGVVIRANYQGNPSKLLISAGTLAHHYYPIGNLGTWSITQLSATGLVPATAYYVYIKASKTLGTAIYYVSTVKIAVEEVGGFYHFPLGVLSSVIDGVRVFTTTKGYTLITGDSIKTGRISSVDGSTYIDLGTGEIRGNFKFTTGASVEDSVNYAYQTGYDAQLLANDALTVGQGAQDYIDNILPSELSDLQNQIDGVVDSWFYPYTPNDANYPADVWTTELLKAQHIGDTFTNTQEYIDDVTTPDAGKSWRFVHITGSEDYYAWTPIADSDAVKALLAASNAQDTADGKRRVFTAQPFTPYEEGDLWSQGSAGDLMKCITTRLTGNYNAADWGKASKYTDDTAAQAAQSTANTAVSNAALAQVAANTANTAIANITSDNVLSAAEKPMQRKEWNIIAGEKAGIDTQATTFGITTEKTAYDVAFENLGTYLNDGETFQIGNIPEWITDVNLASDTVIVGATYRTNWKNYYDARTALLNAIAAKAKTLADTAQTTANNIQVGGRNHFSYANKSISFWDGVSVNTAHPDCPYGFYAVGDVDALNSVRISNVIKSNGYWTLSFEVRGSQNTPVGFQIDVCDYGGTGIWTTGDNTWKKVTLTVNVVNYGDGSLYNFVDFEHFQNAYFYIRNIKVEKGNKATDFTVAPEDSDYILNAMKDGSSDIAGGLLSTNAIFMKNLQGLVAAGMSGSTSDNVAFWAGGTYQNAIDAIAKIIMRMDGSGQLAGGKINWDAAGAMNMGMFTVFNDLLSSGTISFTDSALDDLAAIPGAQTNITAPGPITSNSSHWYQEMQTANFTLTRNAIVKFRMTQAFTMSSYGYLWNYIYVVNAATQEIVQQFNKSKVTSTTQTFNYDQSINLPAGTYYLLFTAELKDPDAANAVTVSVSGFGGSGSYITINPIAALTKIANNGFYSYWGANAYLYLRTDYGFQVMFGNYGIQCTTAGLKKTSTGLNPTPTWTSL